MGGFQQLLIAIVAGGDDLFVTVACLRRIIPHGQHQVFRAAYRVLDGWGTIGVGIEALRLNSLLDQALLLILIVDNEIVLYADVLAISAEDARAERVKRAHRQIIRLIAD